MFGLQPCSASSTTQLGQTANRAARIARQFDEWAPAYDTGRLGGWYQAQALLAFEHLDLPMNGRVLDVGCATGWALRHLAHRRPDITGVGIDVSGAMIAAARAAVRRSGVENLAFLTLDWEGHEDLPGSFDLVICLSVFHYFAEPEAALRRMRSLLSENGQLLLVERAVEGSLLTRAWDVLHRRMIRDHVSFVATGQLEALARRAGFHRVEVVDRINRMMWKNKLYTSLVLIEARA